MNLENPVHGFWFFSSFCFWVEALRGYKFFSLYLEEILSILMEKLILRIHIIELF